MIRLLRDIKADEALADEMVRSGLETIHARHTCAHRVDELAAIVASLRGPGVEKVLNV
jgi:spore maturation protein CgeB